LDSNEDKRANDLDKFIDTDNSNNSNNDSDNNTSFSTSATTRENLLSLMDSFIEQVTSIRKTLLGVSISALFLAPLSIGLSVYLILHPSFFAILEIENEFGLVLSILLIAVLIISSIWLVSGIRQYKSINSWNKRYREYKKEKEDFDRKIASQYGLTMTDTNDRTNP
jgi:hypothetical protein